jgi:hypothetical protein
MRLIAVVVLVAVAALAACRPPGYGGDDDQPAADAPTGGDGAPTVDAAPGDAGGTPDASAAACTFGFSLAGHASASTVWLTGNFLAWAGDPAAGAVELVRGVDGVWRADHGFAAGSYEYKFIVDGTQWIPDPGNAETVPDGFGGVNSVIRCTP